MPLAVHIHEHGVSVGGPPAAGRPRSTVQHHYLRHYFRYVNRLVLPGQPPLGPGLPGRSVEQLPVALDAATDPEPPLCKPQPKQNGTFSVLAQSWTGLTQSWTGQFKTMSTTWSNYRRGVPAAGSSSGQETPGDVQDASGSRANADSMDELGAAASAACAAVTRSQ